VVVLEGPLGFDSAGLADVDRVGVDNFYCSCRSGRHEWAGHSDASADLFRIAEPENHTRACLALPSC
jgi:hypothetical protein